MLVKISGLPNVLIEAWRAYQKVEQPFYDRFLTYSGGGAGISLYDNQRSFSKLMDDIMAGRGENLAEKLNAYQIYGVGNGVDLWPKFIGIFVSLLHDRRLTETAGASLALPGGISGLRADRALTDARIEFLKVCGLDWEAVLAGAEVTRAVGTEPYGAYNGMSHQFWREIATYGSERGAKLVGQLASVEKAKLFPEDIHALGAFLKTDTPLPALEAKGLLSSAKFDEIKRVGSKPISKAIRADLLQSLIGRVEDNPSPEMAMTAIELFTYMRGPEVSAALQALAAHPSPEVAETAARVLRARYEKVETKSTPVSAPVRFQLYINGEPAPKDMHINCAVNFEGSGIGGGAEIGKDGTFEMKREYFLDPTRKPIGVGVSKPATAEDRLFFTTNAPVPSDLDAVIRVDVQTAPLQLMIDSSEGFVRPIGQQASIQFKRLEEGRAAWDAAISAQFDVPLKGPIELSSVQTGAYDVSVLVRGAERWHETVTVGAKTGGVNVKLRPGADLRVEIVPPGTTTRRVDFVFLHEGKEIDPWSVFDSETKTYRGLPCGNYRLRVLATRDQPWARLAAPPPGPDEVPWNALEVPFTIAANSPFLDLGELRLSAAK